MPVASRAKVGRPRRKRPTEKLNLLVDTAAKQRAYNLASERGMSIGRLFEFLIEAAYARMFADGARRRR